MGETVTIDRLDREKQFGKRSKIIDLDIERKNLAGVHHVSKHIDA